MMHGLFHVFLDLSDYEASPAANGEHRDAVAVSTHPAPQAYPTCTGRRLELISLEAVLFPSVVVLFEEYWIVLESAALPQKTHMLIECCPAAHSPYGTLATAQDACCLNVFASSPIPPSLDVTDLPALVPSASTSRQASDEPYDAFTDSTRSLTSTALFKARSSRPVVSQLFPHETEEGAVILTSFHWQTDQIQNARDAVSLSSLIALSLGLNGHIAPMSASSIGKVYAFLSVESSGTIASGLKAEEGVPTSSSSFRTSIA
ncbi:hypothetical protein BD309DRAFT_620893 [Dichomitus squalens]|nr:hypothetical protein BD309DRAFT_620893 [Dichomitus squalens]